VFVALYTHAQLVFSHLQNMQDVWQFKQQRHSVSVDGVIHSRV
jgi:hypothetical protein